jgi:hypothetical protein
MQISREIHQSRLWIAARVGLPPTGSVDELLDTNGDGALAP